MGLLTLLTDFGTADYYVAAVKGVVLRLAPGAVIVDVGHEVAAGGTWRGARFCGGRRCGGSRRGRCIWGWWIRGSGAGGGSWRRGAPAGTLWRLTTG